MGIDGLWQALEPLKSTRPLSSFRGGAPIGVDGDHLLHSMVNKHALQVAKGDTGPFVNKVVKALDGFKRRYKVDFIVVFDGNEDPPVKAEEMTGRREKKDLYRSVGLELLSYGYEAEAESLIKKAPTLTCALKPIAAALASIGVRVLQAPMEAEAQLSYMNRIGEISAVWTGDSDAIVYFSRCVIREIDPRNGMATVYHCGDASLWSRCGSIGRIQEESLFVLMCVAAGSDYSIGKLGGLLRIANTISREANEWKSTSSVTLFDSVFNALLDGAGVVDPVDRLRLFAGVLGFIFHWVYDSRTKSLTHCGGLSAQKELQGTGWWTRQGETYVPKENVEKNDNEALLESIIGNPHPNPEAHCVGLVDLGVDTNFSSESSTAPPAATTGAPPSLQPVSPAASTNAVSPMTSWKYERFQFLPETSNEFSGPFDCKLCRVTISSDQQSIQHRQGALHKGLELILAARKGEPQALVAAGKVASSTTGKPKTVAKEENDSSDG
jgi:exonuclease-1